MVTATLFSFASTNKAFHSFENFIHSSHVLIDKVTGVNL
jgi:hypothetical protein